MLLFFVERLKALVCVVELLHLSSVARAHSHMYLTGDILTLLHSPHISPIWVWQCEYSGSKSRLIKFQHALARHGNAANLEDKTKKNFSSGNWDLFSCKTKSCALLQIGCISTDVHGVYIPHCPQYVSVKSWWLLCRLQPHIIILYFPIYLPPSPDWQICCY